MHLLQRVVRTNQRRLRMQQLILLALRCAFPVCLAFALAGPVLTSADFLPGDAPGRTVIVVDDSYSMRAANPESPEQTAFQSVPEVLADLLETNTEGTETALVSLGDHPSLIVPPAIDRRRIQDQLQAKVHPDSDAASLEAAFDLAEDVLNESTRPRRTVIVVSDFQRRDWSELPAGLQRTDASLAFYRVGKPHEGNVAVESLRLPAVALVAGQEIEIVATIRNYGDSRQDVPLFLRIDGERVAASTTDLPARGTTEVAFTRAIDERGSHLVQVELDVVDPLPFDNRQAAAVEVPERLPVLVVDPEADGKANFLRAALTPFELDGVGVGIEDLIRASFITPDEFAAGQLFGSRAVILNDVKRLSDSQQAALEAFVRDGGGLIVLPGTDTDIDWHNESLFSTLAPSVRWGRRIPSPKNSTKILRQRSEHPVFEVFNQTDNGDPAAADIRTSLQLHSNEGSEVIASLGNGPFVVESSHHPGRVLIAAVGTDPQWSNMPEYGFFVPLMQRLVVYAATNTVPPRNVELGQPLVALLHPKTVGDTLELTDPAGHTHRVVAQAEGGVAKAVFTESTIPGPWTLTNPHGIGPIRFAVQSDRSESDLDLLSRAEVAAMADRCGAAMLQSRADLEAFERKSRFGTEIWRPFLIVAVLLLFADVFLAQRFVQVAASQDS